MKYSETHPLSCIISFLYIKPQPSKMLAQKATVVLYRFSTSNHNANGHPFTNGEVVLYRFSTSNHNLLPVLSVDLKLYYIVSLHQTTTQVLVCCFVQWLYYIVSLHQTTTRGVWHRRSLELYYIVSLHQTTTKGWRCIFRQRCIISFLYIKPQLEGEVVMYMWVVLYRFSTSNHNWARAVTTHSCVVLYRFSTSNHNLYHLHY